jgi:Zn-dependent protease
MDRSAVHANIGFGVLLVHDNAALVQGIFELVLVLFSLSFHEAAHAWMASRLGDQTARMLGRVTLDPTKHIDPIGTVLIPAIAIFGPLFGFGGFGRFLIGWAKPTPVQGRNFKHFVRDSILTTLAGPVSNLILATAATLLLLAVSHFVPGGSQAVHGIALGIMDFNPGSFLSPLVMLLYLGIFVNLSLAIFNLMPFPPLDGSRILFFVLPTRFQAAYESMGIFSLILMVIVGGRLVGFILGPAIYVVRVALISL